MDRGLAAEDLEGHVLEERDQKARRELWRLAVSRAGRLGVVDRNGL